MSFAIICGTSTSLHGSHSAPREPVMSCMAVYKGAALYRVVLSIAHTVPQKKDKDRRDSKGHHYCLEDRIDSILCNFSPGLFEEWDEFILQYSHIVLVQFILFINSYRWKIASMARN